MSDSGDAGPGDIATTFGRHGDCDRQRATPFSRLGLSTRQAPVVPITAAVGSVLDNIFATASFSTVGGSFLDHPFMSLITYSCATTNISVNFISKNQCKGKVFTCGRKYLLEFGLA